MREEYERRFRTKSLAWQALSEEARATGKKPEPVKIRTDVAKEFWALETNEAQEEIEKEAEEEHNREVEAWEADRKLPMTPQQFHQ